MNRDAQQWVKKAEEDYRVASRLFRMRPNPAYDAVCFHAQQCIEKYFKGALVANDESFPKIHDLRVLLTMLLPNHPDWGLFQSAANMLTEYAVFFRYPGRWADKSLARDAINACNQIRDAVRLGLRLKSDKKAKAIPRLKTMRKRPSIRRRK